MIDIVRFGEWLAELAAAANTQNATEIGFVSLAVREEQLVKTLGKAESEICLCATYPDARMEGGPDSATDLQSCILFVLRKNNPDDGDGSEFMSTMRELQRTMLAVRKLALDTVDCSGMVPEQSPAEVEWEYQIFGGFDGLSMSFKFSHYDGTVY